MVKSNTAIAKEGAPTQWRSDKATRPSSSCGELGFLRNSVGNQAFGRFIQTKLRISEPGDAFEQEADRVADEVMRAPDPTAASLEINQQKTGPSVQRACASCEEEEEVQRKASGDSAQTKPTQSSLVKSGEMIGGGQPLPATTRAFFEPRFGYDFGDVRVHTDPRAADSARSIDALAYTTGRDIVFGDGQYAPETSAGRKLLAHELAHTLQQGADKRISRQCISDLGSTPTPAGDSVLIGSANLNLGTVPVSSDITAGPLVGTFHVKLHVPRELQRAVAPDFLGLRDATIGGSISLEASGGGSRPPIGTAGNELCVFVTFHREPGQTGTIQSWFADLRILKGGHLDAPLQIGLGGPTVASGSSPLGAGAARIQLRLTNDLTASVGPLTLNTLDDVKTIWTSIQSQVSERIALEIGNIQVPLTLRAGAALTVPVPFGGGETTGAGIIPVHVAGDIEVTTQTTQSGDRFTIILAGGGKGSALGGAVSVELSGSGHLRTRLPSTIRLADLSTDFLNDLIARSEGGGELRGRITAFGLPGVLNTDFRIQGRRMIGDATFLSPLGVGGGTFRYHLDQGLSADLGFVGLTRLAIAPAQERLPWQSIRESGLQPYDFGTSVTGLGVTGVHMTPDLTHILSIGGGPQFVTTPENKTEVGAYGGITYTLTFPGL
jgi:hypothetical protein